MAKKHTPKALAAAIGATFVASMVASPVVSADANPFAMSPLTSGYQVAGKDGNCGGMKKDGKAGSCGGKRVKKPIAAARKMAKPIAAARKATPKARRKANVAKVSAAARNKFAYT